MSNPQPRAGLHVTPTIVLSHLLGQGGMGSVWMADHLKFQIKVVVKFMAEEFASNPEALARFEREAALAAQAKSPHVVQIYDHGISSIGLPYIAMELLEGEDLASRMQRLGRVAPNLYAGWLWQICAGLSRAHAKGIVHRDVKPENVFLCDEEGETLVKILDFGIAKSPLSTGGFSATRTGVMMGTAYYMSPEQTMGAKNIDQRTDVWAVGAMSYHALTGVRPFDAESLGALVYAITQGPILPPSRHNPELSPEIDAWTLKALERNPEARFATVKELATAFLAAVSGVEPHSTQAVPGAPYGQRAPFEKPAASSGIEATVAALPSEVKTAESPIHPAQSKDTITGWGQTNPSARRSRHWLLLVALAAAAGVVGGLAYFLGGRSSPSSTEQDSTAPLATGEGLVPTTEPDARPSSESAPAPVPPPQVPPAPVEEPVQEPPAAPAAGPRPTAVAPAAPTGAAAPSKPASQPAPASAPASAAPKPAPSSKPKPATATGGPAATPQPAPPQPAPSKPSSTLGGRL